MEKVTLARKDLLERVKKNRSGHEAMYKDAVEGYLKVVINAMEKTLSDARKGILPNPYDMNRYPQPENHMKDYDRVISMLSCHTKDEVELSNEDFGRYYEDDWDWKARWTTSNSAYTGLGKR